MGSMQQRSFYRRLRYSIVRCFETMKDGSTRLCTAVIRVVTNAVFSAFPGMPLHGCVLPRERDTASRGAQSGDRQQAAHKGLSTIPRANTLRFAERTIQIETKRTCTHKTASNYLISNANVSIGDVEPMLLDVVQTLSRVNARGRFVPA